MSPLVVLLALLAAAGVALVRPRVGIAGIGVDEVDVEVPHDLGWLLEASRAGEARSAEARSAEAPTSVPAALADVTETA